MICAFCGNETKAGWGHLNLCRPCLIVRKNEELRKWERGELKDESNNNLSKM